MITCYRLIIGGFTQTSKKACKLNAPHFFCGATAWRWWLFLTLYPALDFVIWVIVFICLEFFRQLCPSIYVRPSKPCQEHQCGIPLVCNSAIAHADGRSVASVTCHTRCVTCRHTTPRRQEPPLLRLYQLCNPSAHRALAVQSAAHRLHDEIAHFVRQSVWLGMWFAVMAEPLDWAREAKDWNGLAGEQVWDDRLLEVNQNVWRVLTLLVVWTAMQLIKEVVIGSLSTTFHRKDRFNQLAVRCLPPSDSLPCVFTHTLWHFSMSCA
jgi:hypothetical protein